MVAFLRILLLQFRFISAAAPVTDLFDDDWGSLRLVDVVLARDFAKGGVKLQVDRIETMPSSCANRFNDIFE